MNCLSRQSALKREVIPSNSNQNNNNILRTGRMGVKVYNTVFFWLGNFCFVLEIELMYINVEKTITLYSLLLTKQ